ncbi:hypothetical protein BH10BAC3_BH10BAC3_23650 [soil metagenome]
MRNFTIVIAKALFINFLITNPAGVQAQPVAGKMYFSDKPFTTTNEGSKKSFTSAEYIYGRFELDNASIQEAFRIFEPNENYPHAYFFYRVYIYFNEQEMGFNSSVNLCLLRGDSRKNKWFNFDVLPEPAKATTALCGTNRFNTSLSTTPLYSLINADNFKQNGEYKIAIKFYYESYDAFNNMEPVEKWPTMEESFSFVFNAKDVAQIKKNELASDEVIQKKGLK